MSSTSAFSPLQLAMLKEFKYPDGKFEGHKVVMNVIGIRSPGFEPQPAVGVIVCVGTQFTLRFGTITMKLPTHPLWDEVVEQFNESNNVFEITGYEEPEDIS